MQLPRGGAAHAVEHRHQHGPVHGPVGAEVMVVHAGEQILLIDIPHRLIVPVGVAHVIERGSRAAALGRGVAALHPHAGPAGQDGKHGGGVLPHQIAVVRLQRLAGGHLSPGGDVHHRPGMGHPHDALQQQDPAARGQGDGVPLPPALGGQGGALLLLAPAGGVLARQRVQRGLGAVIGLLELVIGRRRPLLHGGGNEGIVQIAQAHQPIRGGDGPGPAGHGRQHPGGAQQPDHSFFHWGSSSGGSFAFSDWEII